MPRSRLVARVSPGALRVEAERAGRVLWSAGMAFTGGDELAVALGSLKEVVQHQRLPRSLTVLVAPPLVQRRTLTDLPPVRPAELSRLVAQAAPRFFRQNGHPLVSAAAWQDSGENSGRVAQAAALDIDLAEAIVAGADRAGLRLLDIHPEPATPGLSLLPPEERARRRRREWRRVAHLAVGAVAVWLLLGAFLGVRLLVDTRRVEHEIARLAAPRRALLAARQQMDSAGDMLTALDGAQAARPLMAARIAALVHALPDSTYLTALSLDSAGRGVAAGRTRGVGALVDVLDTTLGLGPVRLEGATVRDTTAGVAWERFSLRLGQERVP
jgi:hypothetical protein